MSTEKAVSPQGLAGAKAVAIGEDDGLILFHAAGIATRSVSTVEEAEKALLSLIREGSAHYLPLREFRGADAPYPSAIPEDCLSPHPAHTGQ